MSVIVPLSNLSGNSILDMTSMRPKDTPEAGAAFSSIFLDGTVGEISKSLNRVAKTADSSLRQEGNDSLKTALEVLNASTAVKQGTTIFSTALQSYREVLHMQI